MAAIVEHPIAAQWLADLRDEATRPAEFRRLVRRLGAMLFMEASRDLEQVDGVVRTPLAEAPVRMLARQPVLAPVLRAGLAMADGILDFLPDAPVCHIGMYRDHHTLQAILYYPADPNASSQLPPDSVVYILDPMLATGGSAVAAIAAARRWRPASIKLLSVVGAPEGVARVEDNCPDAAIYLCALDKRLNEIGYIVPGLGDAGDRQFSGG